MKKSLLLLSTLLLAGFSAYTWSSQAPDSRNGSPKSNSATCANSSCHSGPAKTDQSILISTDIPSNGFEIGKEYQITITANRGSSLASTSGFQASIESINGFEGALSSGGASNIRINGQGTFVSHKGKQNFSNGLSTWSFKWVPNASTLENVTIYTAVNFANNNGGTSGDVIVTNSLSLLKAINISIAENNLQEIALYPNPASNVLIISFNPSRAKAYKIDVYNAVGTKVQTLFNSEITDVALKQFDVSHLTSGMYIVQVESEGTVTRKRLMVE